MFALLLALMFFFFFFLIALTFIVAIIPDFDHKFQKDHVYKLIILGLIVFISLYILKLPYLIGLIIVFLGVTFYFSEHRSFTHSIFGVLTLTSAVSLIMIWGYELVMGVTILNDSYFVMAVLIAILSFLFLNKKLLMVFLPLFFVSLFFINDLNMTYIEIVLALFLGLFSHVVLDSFTPAGIKIFAPLSSKKVYKRFGLISIFVLITLAIVYNIPVLYKLFEQYAYFIVASVF